MHGLGMRKRRFLYAFGGLLAAACAASIVYALAGDAAPALETLFTSYLYNAVLLGAALLCLLRAAWVKSQRSVWLAMGVGMLAWTAGEIYYSTASGDVPIPSPADLGYLGLYPAAYVAILLLLRSQVTSFDRSVWLDGAIAGMAVAAVAATVAAGPIVDASVDGDQLAVATNLAYPIGDLVLLMFVVMVFGITGWRPGWAWVLLGTGLATMAVADGVYLLQSALGTYVEGGLLDAAWQIAAVLVGYAAWAPATAAAPAPLHQARAVVAPTVAALIAVALATYDHFDPLPTAALLLASATLVAVAFRMAISFRENQRMLATSRREARIDALTGLGNRRLLNRELVAATNSPPAAGTERLLVLLDLDGFKSYNDSFGHPAGDSLLARIGGRLADVSRQYGRAFRLGGDEFCVLAECDAQTVDGMLAGTVRALSEQGDGFHITPSYGVVRLPHEAGSPAAALQLADRRMYANKAQGRASAGRQSRDVLISALRERQPELHEHVTDVAALAHRVAEQLGMNAEERDEVARAAELHDVGKVAIPDAILNKPGPLDEAEWAFMHSHTIVGERILSAAPALLPVARLVRSSHERWDGGGYPDGLRGEQIPLGARVVTVCDAFEAMVADRPYRAPKSQQEALEELERCSGSQFDPAVVAAFKAVVQRQPTAA